MIDGYARGLTLAAAVGAGITAGVYFAFSTFIMTGLRRLSHAQSIAAMNAINKAAPNPLFMLALFGTAIVWWYWPFTGSGIATRRPSGSYSGARSTSSVRW
jgi:uncharacterized membrane protein